MVKTSNLKIVSCSHVIMKKRKTIVNSEMIKWFIIYFVDKRKSVVAFKIENIAGYESRLTLF